MSLNQFSLIKQILILLRVQWPTAREYSLGWLSFPLFVFSWIVECLETRCKCEALLCQRCLRQVLALIIDKRTGKGYENFHVADLCFLSLLGAVAKVINLRRTTLPLLWQATVLWQIWKSYFLFGGFCIGRRVIKFFPPNLTVF